MVNGTRAILELYVISIVFFWILSIEAAAKKNWSSKDHTWSVVPNALLGIIQWRSGVKQQGIGPEGLMSCRTQGRISKCLEGAYFRLYMTNLGWKAELRLGEQIWGLEGKFEVWRADLKANWSSGAQIWGLEVKFWARGWLIWSLEGRFEAWRAKLRAGRANLRLWWPMRG